MTERLVVVDHVLFVVSDLTTSRRLYAAALAPLGIVELHCNNVEAVFHSPQPIVDAPRRADVP
ncbi:hypothetical protein BH18ACT17_BH18ACT17_05720 [soil metagenome]